MNDHKQAVYFAKCDCEMAVRVFRDYNDRADWVGRHRVRTGHTVGMWIGVDPA